MEIIWKLHSYVYRLSGGRVGKALGGAPVLLLITTGRRSGEPRPVTLTYFEDGERLIVIASNAGEDRHPAWWLNLQEHPDATVQIGGSTMRVRAMEAIGEDRYFSAHDGIDHRRRPTDEEAPNERAPNAFEELPEVEVVITVAPRILRAGQNNDPGREGIEYKLVEDKQVHSVEHQQHHEGAHKDREED